jgi:hypothetical protein
MANSKTKTVGSNPGLSTRPVFVHNDGITQPVPTGTAVDLDRRL